MAELKPCPFCGSRNARSGEEIDYRLLQFIIDDWLNTNLESNVDYDKVVSLKEKIDKLQER